MSSVLPFRLLGEKDIDDCRNLIAERAGKWSREWFSNPPEGDVHISEASEADVPGEDWSLVVSSAPEAWVAWQLPKQEWLMFARLLLGPGLAARGNPSTVVSEVLKRAQAGFACTLLGDEMAPVVENCSARRVKALRSGYGSGVVAGQLGGGFPPIRFMIGGAVFDQLDRSQDELPVSRNSLELVPRERAIGRRKVGMEVVLGEAELNLGDLAGLGAGDVLLLQRQVSTPLELRITGEAAVLKAHLGMKDGMKAVQVIATKS